MIGAILCRLGKHKKHLFKEGERTHHEDGSVSVYSTECRRCGKRWKETYIRLNKKKVLPGGLISDEREVTAISHYIEDYVCNVPDRGVD